MFLVPLIVGESFMTRESKLLWLAPGLYWYWILQLAVLASVMFEMVFMCERLDWHHTKVRVD